MIKQTNLSGNSSASLKVRYFFKLSSSFASLAANLVIQALVPRALGPKDYGSYSFLTNFFTQVISFLEAGTSIGFYTKLSQRTKDSGLVRFYLYFSILVSFGIVGLVFINHLLFTYIHVWPNQQLLYIYLAAIWSILTWIAQILNKMTDAFGLTVFAERALILRRILGILLILAVFFSDSLTLAVYFYYSYFLLILMISALAFILSRHGYPIDINLPPLRETKEYTKELYLYSHPLIIYSVVGLITGVLDRWLLQIYGGNIQQGLFGLSYQVGAICFLFTGAMTPLLTREFSIASVNSDLKMMAGLFRRYIPLMYAIAAYFSSFIALQADKVILLFGGLNYTEAIVPLIIMAFYPIHQTYGQLSGAVFYATGQTQLYRNIGIIFMLIGLPLTYFLIAPPERFGLNTGAVGLAVKMVLLQLLAVNVQLYYNAKYLKISFKKYLCHQIFSLCFFLAAAEAAIITVNWIAVPNMWLSFMLSGVLYTLLAILFIVKTPEIIGLHKHDLRNFAERAKQYFKLRS